MPRAKDIFEELLKGDKRDQRPLKNKETLQIKKAKKLIIELDKLISMNGQFEFCPDFNNPHITQINDISFWIKDIFHDNPKILSSLNEFIKQNDEQSIKATIQDGIEEIIATAKALMLGLKPESIYEELNWLVISHLGWGSCTERLRIWRTFATLVIESSSNPTFASDVALAAKGFDEILFMLIQILYNIMSCAASSKMIWTDLNLNGAYLWVIERIKFLDCDFAEKMKINDLPERIPMGENDDIEWQVMWENHWHSEMADAISSIQKRLLDNPVPIPEDHDWNAVIKQYRDQVDKIQKWISDHNRISEAAFKKLLDKLPPKTNLPNESKPCPRDQGERSLPMSLTDMANRLGNMDWRKAKKFLSKYDLRQEPNSKKSWTVRLDLMDSGSRKKLEK